jgi:hypothetical protein
LYVCGVHNVLSAHPFCTPILYVCVRSVRRWVPTGGSTAVEGASRGWVSQRGVREGEDFHSVSRRRRHSGSRRWARRSVSRPLLCDAHELVQPGAHLAQKAVALLHEAYLGEDALRRRRAIAHQVRRCDAGDELVKADAARILLLPLAEHVQNSVRVSLSRTLEAGRRARG